MSMSRKAAFALGAILVLGLLAGLWVWTESSANQRNAEPPEGAVAGDVESPAMHGVSVDALDMQKGPGPSLADALRQSRLDAVTPATAVAGAAVKVVELSPAPESDGRGIVSIQYDAGFKLDIEPGTKDMEELLSMPVPAPNTDGRTMMFESHDYAGVTLATRERTTAIVATAGGRSEEVAVPAWIEWSMGDISYQLRGVGSTPLKTLLAAAESMIDSEKAR